MEQVQSFDLPELAPYRTMRRQLEHREQRILVAEGPKVVRRLIQSRFQIVSVLLTPEWLESFEPLLRDRPEWIRAFVAVRDRFRSLIGFPMYQCALAVGRLPPPPALETVLRTSPRPWLLAAVDGIASAENTGVIVRNCAAFGVHALLVGETACSPYLRRAVRSSMGAIFQLPVAELNDLAHTLGHLRRRGCRCLAAHPHTDRHALTQTDLCGDCCIVFGSEGHGLSAPVLAACEAAVTIPLAPGVDSLNVGSATAVFLHEARRQRAARP